MPSRPRFLADVSWFQVVASALAAVTAAWIASSLGVAGTLIGAALGSFVVTISSAFYGRTLDQGKTLIVQTASGTVVQKQVDEGEIAEAFEEVEEAEGSPVARAEVVGDDTAAPRRLHWKTITATTVVVLAIALAAMGAYEVVTQRSFGADPDNARIGNPFGGSSRPSDDDRGPKPTESTPTPTSTQTPEAPAATTPAPAATTPAPVPTASEPAPTATPTPSVPTPTPTATPTTSPRPTTPTPTRPAE
ncbi:hypothetical protein [Aeromicrobium fastidiosum]|uniref:hypothetical protein n=1 Tax=Aeromicrobium fastidiosum TaxID=52699 RepID=UPI00165F29EE|nr:hypothetical protein [Aeromicrobium fastidiosum]MBP2392043.1 cytoskeletal protein RodZ [Aeromicrobium fastidiosum]